MIGNHLKQNDQSAFIYLTHQENGLITIPFMKILIYPYFHHKRQKQFILIRDIHISINVNVKLLFKIPKQKSN